MLNVCVRAGGGHSGEWTAGGDRSAYASGWRTAAGGGVCASVDLTELACARCYSSRCGLCMLSCAGAPSCQQRESPSDDVAKSRRHQWKVVVAVELAVLDVLRASWWWIGSGLQAAAVASCVCIKLATPAIGGGGECSVDAGLASIARCHSGSVACVCYAAQRVLLLVSSV
jgi:hypothetical protein